MQTHGHGFHLDAQSLQGLRQRAQTDRDAALREAAGQFEALFVQMMLKSMRQASHGDALFGSDQGDYYRDLLDRQLASDLSAGRGIGLADLLVRQLRGAVGGPAPLPRGAAQAVGALPEDATPAGPGAAAPPWPTPQAFVRSVLPQAEAAARRLGVDPALLVAQAALETGWGAKVARHADGSNSYALFGIKADGRWDGNRVSVNTLEFDGGRFRPERAEFRAYPSAAAAFSDYARFIGDSERYAEARSQAGHPRAYLQGLQDAGYATDPQYADKIWRIYRGEVIQSGLSDARALTADAAGTRVDKG